MSQIVCRTGGQVGNSRSRYSSVKRIPDARLTPKCGSIPKRKLNQFMEEPFGVGLFSELEVIAPLPVEVPQRHLELQQVSCNRGKVRARDVDLTVFGHTFLGTKEVKIEHD